MASSRPPAYPAERELAWTERQCEVLALLVKGQTNAQIADHFGISLDGAKWHVREIMGKLGVDSREEAADYWRARNSTGARVRRALGVFGAITHSGTTARLILGSAAAAIAVGAFVVVLVLIRAGGDDPTLPAGSTSVAAPTPIAATPAGSTSPSATHTASPLAPGQAIATFNGAPVYQLVPTAIDTGQSLPAGSVLYFTDSCNTCPSGELYRFRQAKSGGWQREPLLTANQPGLPTGDPLQPVALDGAGRFAVTWCLTDHGYCGKQQDSSVDDTPRALVLSNDGGVTWNVVTQLPPGGFVAGFEDGEIVVGSPPNGTSDIKYALYPSGRSASPPELFYPAIQVGDKTVRVEFEEPGHPLGNPGSSPMYGVSVGGQAPSEYSSFIAGNLQLRAGISATMLLGSAERNPKAMLIKPPTELGGFERLPVIVNLEAHTISPIAGLKPKNEFGFITPLALKVGKFVQVTNAGDCLNVRERPDTSAPVIACFADNVLLGDRGETTEAGGVAWVAVSTPDGAEGWAAEEFLER